MADDDTVQETEFEGAEGKSRVVAVCAVVFVFVFATDPKKVTESFFDMR